MPDAQEPKRGTGQMNFIFMATNLLMPEALWLKLGGDYGIDKDSRFKDESKGEIHTRLQRRFHSSLDEQVCQDRGSFPFAVFTPEYDGA